MIYIKKKDVNYDISKKKRMLIMRVPSLFFHKNAIRAVVLARLTITLV